MLGTREKLPYLFALIAGLATFAVFPRGLIPLNDGFGYIRSIVLTFQHGRPWTDDWLEPWSAGFSTLCTVVLYLTHSMYIATYGVCAVLGGLSVWLLIKLLRERGCSVYFAGCVALAIQFFPTLQWKFVEVNCFSVYFVCLLGCIWFSDKKKWVGFLICWCIALATRQSAVAWGVMPLLHGLWTSRLAKKTPRLGGDWYMPWMVIALGALWFLAVRAFMNKTHSQAVITDHVIAAWSLRNSYGTMIKGIITAVLAVGLSSFIFGARPQWRDGYFVKSAAALLFLGSFLLLLKFDVREFIAFDDDAFDSKGFRIYLCASIILAVTGLAITPLKFRPAGIAAALGAVALVSVRNVTWDYYLADAFVFAFFAAKGRPETTHDSVATVIASAAVIFSLGFIVHFKIKYDKAYAVGTLGWIALESGRLQPSEASFLPFGLMGWYYFPYYSTHNGKDTADIGAFGDYMKQDTVELWVRYPWPLRRLHAFESELPKDRTNILAEGRFNFCWFTYADYVLKKAPASRVKPGRGDFPKDFILPPFPANDSQWWELLQSKPLDGQKASSSH